MPHGLISFHDIRVWQSMVQLLLRNWPVVHFSHALKSLTPSRIPDPQHHLVPPNIHLPKHFTSNIDLLPPVLSSCFTSLHTQLRWCSDNCFLPRIFHWEISPPVRFCQKMIFPTSQPSFLPWPWLYSKLESTTYISECVTFNKQNAYDTTFSSCSLQHSPSLANWVSH